MWKCAQRLSQEIYQIYVVGKGRDENPVTRKGDLVVTAGQNIWWLFIGKDIWQLSEDTSCLSETIQWLIEAIWWLSEDL